MMAFACLATTSLQAAETPAPSESLDNKLLEDLKLRLLDELKEPPAESQSDRSADSDSRPSPPTDDAQRPTSAQPDAHGEDLGASRAASPLAAVEARMRQAEALIPQVDAPQAASEVQQQVVADLDALIDQLQQQAAACQSGQCDTQSQSQSSQRSQSASSQPKPAGGEGQAAAQDSTNRVGQENARDVDMAEMQALIKDLWGHLPERVREQMLQTPADEFLPKYELEIERYFRRLAEEQNNDASRP